MDTLTGIIDGKYSADSYVSFDAILFPVPTQFRSSMKELVIYIVSEIYKIKITEDEKIIMPQNYIGVPFVEFEGDYFGLISKEYPSKYKLASSVQRYRFEDRFQMFKDFVETYHRFPSYNGGDKEASLMRWYYNVAVDFLSVTLGSHRLCKFAPLWLPIVYCYASTY